MYVTNKAHLSLILLSYCKDFVGDPFVQVVVPKKIRDQVLKTVHDSSGQLGVNLTSKNI